MVPKIVFKQLPGPYAISRLSPNDPVPEWVEGDGFTSVSRSDNELSIVCREKRVPSDVQTERGWRCMKVVGPFGLDETGIIYAIVKPLAEEKIGIFLVSTYDGDHLLVKADDLDRTHEALRKAGYSFA
ncbi:ACT domain-containing protein [Segnochrobactrum spirostomi]|uniref:ACT domain-containing protein n=1 Tax=Segnochrobactrum spirostomi TaxID=2608987 RepID=A0A6A7Y1A5_9HYPH|nr:ACT domain-containing protein [Segnochrobactrum spirostomi]MQT12446.1 ACT domain-containing protein [Segnochrobactrum spirostomi]